MIGIIHNRREGESCRLGLNITKTTNSRGCAIGFIVYLPIWVDYYIGVRIRSFAKPVFMFESQALEDKILIERWARGIDPYGMPMRRYDNGRT